MKSIYCSLARANLGHIAAVALAAVALAAVL